MNELIKGLNQLLHMNYTASAGYKKIASAVSSRKLSSFLIFKSGQRMRFAKAIRDEILLLESSPTHRPTIELSGDWTDIVRLAQMKNEEKILDRTEKYELGTINVYESFLSIEDIPTSLKSRLINQQKEIANTVTEMIYLEDAV